MDVCVLDLPDINKYIDSFSEDELKLLEISVMNFYLLVTETFSVDLPIESTTSGELVRAKLKNGTEIPAVFVTAYPCSLVPSSSNIVSEVFAYSLKISYAYTFSKLVTNPETKEPEEQIEVNNTPFLLIYVFNDFAIYEQLIKRAGK